MEADSGGRVIAVDPARVPLSCIRRITPSANGPYEACYATLALSHSIIRALFIGEYRLKCGNPITVT